MDWQDAQMVYFDFDPVFDPKIWVNHEVYGYYSTQKELKVKTLRHFWGPIGRPQGTFNNLMYFQDTQDVYLDFDPHFRPQSMGEPWGIWLFFIPKGP